MNTQEEFKIKEIDYYVDLLKGSVKDLEEFKEIYAKALFEVAFEELKYEIKNDPIYSKNPVLLQDLAWRSYKKFREIARRVNANYSVELIGAEDVLLLYESIEKYESFVRSIKGKLKYEAKSK